MGQVLEWIRNFLNTPLAGSEGAVTLTVGNVLTAFFVFVLLVIATGQLKRRILRPVLRRTTLSINAQAAASKILGYVIVVFGTLVIIQSIGINLTTLNVLAGAVGIGIGFGLQNVASNFISGLIIIFERPIKLGDRIAVGNVLGDVIAINARSTTVLTNDNIAIIVPNEAFISQNVTNWSYTDNTVRFKIPVGVAYGSDTRLVEKLLLQVARDNEHVLTDPPPLVRFMEFGDSSFNFELRVWTKRLINREGRLRSDLNFAIDDAFRQNGVEIPFPQRDLHLRSVSEGVRLNGGDREGSAGGDGGVTA